MSRPREIRIGLLWHASGAGNLGVGALTVGNMMIARDAAAALGLTPRFTLLEFATDAATPYVSGPDIDTFEINTRSMALPSGYAARIRKLDCILDIGAGDSWTDIYGAKRFAFLYASKVWASLLGVPLMFSPQTIGPFSRQPFTRLAAGAMRRAVAVGARDPQSFEAIGKLAPRAHAFQSVDVAFRLPFERPARPAGGPLEIGVNVSGLLFNRGYTGGNEFGLQVDYAGLMRGFLQRMSARNDVRAHLICHVNSDRLPMDDDGRVADRLAAEFPGVVRAPDFASPSAAKSYIAGMDFMTAGRMHACIAAFSAGVPVVPVAYSRKFAGLFEGVLGYHAGVPVTGMTTEAALDYLCEQVDRRAELAKDIETGLAVVSRALAVYDAELRTLFARVAPVAEA